MVTICMIALYPAGIEIDPQGLINSNYTNDDGFGWAIASNDGIVVGKDMDFDTGLEALLKERKNHGEESIVLAHLRWATAGVLDEFNVHPFYVDADGETVVAHNGIFDYKYQPTKSDPRSDTRIFVDNVLPDYIETPRGVPSRRAGRKLGKMIGSGNKLVFLSTKSGTPKARIINAHLGEQDSGIWYSNSGYLPLRWSGWKGSPSSLWNNDSWAYDTEKADAEWWAEQDKILDETCPSCGSIGHIDRAAGICELCQFCVDCGSDLTDCLCYVPESTFSVDAHGEVSRW